MNFKEACDYYQDQSYGLGAFQVDEVFVSLREIIYFSPVRLSLIY